MWRKFSIVLLLCVVCVSLSGADTLRLNLQECRSMALKDNTRAQLDNEAVQAASYMRQAAIAAMFPKFNANAGYSYNIGEMHLLSNTTEFSYGTVTAYNDNGKAQFVFSDNNPLADIASELRSLPFVGTRFSNVEQEVGQMIADAYQQLYNKLSPDLTHVLIGQVGVVQPVYLGGRLIEAYRIACAAQHIAEIEQETHADDILYSVDEAYWRVVLVKTKAELAERYCNLLLVLEDDVSAAVDAGLATGSDLLAVRVKRSEAQKQLMQARNGLMLSQMELCRVCGMPLSTYMSLDESLLSSLPLLTDTAEVTDAEAGKEMVIMDEMTRIARSQVRITAAALQPNIMASANYIYTNPHVEDGFSTDWKGKGWFTAGVVLNIPIAHADDILRLKAAKHTARMAELRRDETRQLLTMRTTNSRQKLVEAQQQVMLAETSIKNADENLAYAQELHQAGLVTSSDLMQAQTVWLAAHTDLIEAQVELRMAETAYLKNTGQLTAPQSLQSKTE